MQEDKDKNSDIDVAVKTDEVPKAEIEKEVINQSSPVVETEALVETNDVSEVENEVGAEVAPEESKSLESAVAETKPTRSNLRLYLLTGVAVVVMAVGLLFVMEREGRVTTGIFGDIRSGQPVALVNGEKITRQDFDSSFNQLLQMAQAQGADTTDETMMEQYRTQAVDTLVNGELLRQAAKKEGVEATAEAIETRYTEIESSIGGAEQLTARLAEFGITEKILRRDIENEILIQNYFDLKLTSDDAEVTKADVEKFYTDLGGAEAGLPPLDEVYDQAVEQIKLDRQQVEVNALLESLRTEAEIEVLL